MWTGSYWGNKVNIHLKRESHSWVDTFPVKTSRWPTDTWKDAQRHSSSGKHKSKLQWDITSHQSEWLKWTNQETIDAGEDVEKREPSCTVGGNANLCTLENSVEVPQKIKNRTTLWPSNSTARNLPKGYRSVDAQGHLYPNVYKSTFNNSQIMDRA